MLVKNIFKYFTSKKYRVGVNNVLGLYKHKNDEKLLKLLYKSNFNKELNLNNPQTYNEKIQWLKLYYRKKIFTTMVDKIEAKEYVSRIIGKEYIIPTIGVYNNFDEIDFDQLPNQFVIKCSHDSGGIFICKNKEYFDKNFARKKINKYQKRDFYLGLREWPYKNVPHRILVEQYMEDKITGELIDYKFFTFNGKVKALFIASDRQNPNEETKFDFFDENFNHLPIINGHPNAKIRPSKPINFELMKYFAEKLSQNLPHLRVDFYEINGKVFFGEMTFYHWSGLVPFEPEEWDYVFGSWIDLPEKCLED